MKRKPEKLSTIKNRLRKLRDGLARRRDENKCQHGNKPCCTKTDKKGRTILHVSHIYPVGLYPHMEFELDNVKLLCFFCHFFWWHKSPIDASNWIADYLSAQRYRKLLIMANNPVEVTREYLYEQETKLNLLKDACDKS